MKSMPIYQFPIRIFNLFQKDGSRLLRVHGISHEGKEYFFLGDIVRFDQATKLNYYEYNVRVYPSNVIVAGGEGLGVGELSDLSELLSLYLEKNDL